MTFDPRRQGTAAPPDGDAHAARIVQGALRSLLRSQRAEDAVAVLIDTIERLGGEVIPAPHEHRDDVLPVDVSFGFGGPMVPRAAQASLGRMYLERHLAGLFEDTRAAVANLQAAQVLARDASLDPLTGLLNRRALERVLARLSSGDTVALIDLDYFKDVNDSLGHEAGDRVLASFARALRSVVREVDYVSRHGGEEFVVVFPSTPADAVVAVLDRVAATWATERPEPVTFSAGVAEGVAGEAGSAVLARADAALFRSKAAGRACVKTSSLQADAAGPGTP